MKRRKLKLLANSETIYQINGGLGTSGQPSTANVLPSVGAGFAALTTQPRLIAADKTRYIKLLDRVGKYEYMFLRPRRFGKSTFLQTLATYYDKKLQQGFSNTFGGLYIGRDPTPFASKLLVLCFNFSAIRVSTSYEEVVDTLFTHIHHTLRVFLTENSDYLSKFDQDKLLDGKSAGVLLWNVLVRYLL